MQEFSFSTRIFFGEGALERLRRVEGRRVLIVTDRFMVQVGAVEKVVSYLSRCEVTVFDGVVPDPPIEVVAAGVDAFAECQAETVIAVGGGSTLMRQRLSGRLPRKSSMWKRTRWSALLCQPRVALAPRLRIMR